LTWSRTSWALTVGEFLHTLDSMDIQTCWVERARRSWAKVATGSCRGHDDHCTAVGLFPLCGMDSDNGSVFINNHLYACCPRLDRPIPFTRSRPKKKDDNAHVEQKNWPPVRKLIGWDRYDSPEALVALKALYADLGSSRTCSSPQ